MSFFKSGMKPVFDVAIRFIENISLFIVNIGGLLTDIAAELGPWFAPLSPAIFSYMNLTEILGFSTVAAVPVAASIEFVGLAVTNTMVTVWVGNRRNTAQKNQVPLRPLFGIFGWYLITVLGLNVALAFAEQFLSVGSVFESDVAFGIVVLGVHAALVLMEVPAAAIIGFRRTYRNLLEEISEEKEARSSRRASVSVSPSVSVSASRPRGASKKDMVKEVLNFAQERGLEPTIEEIKDLLESRGHTVSTGTISEARKEYNAFS